MTDSESESEDLRRTLNKDPDPMIPVSGKGRCVSRPEENTSFKSVFVGNLDFSISDRELDLMFSMFGEVADVFIPRDEGGYPKGFGFVSFKDAECALESTQSSGISILGRNLTISKERSDHEKARSRGQRTVLGHFDHDDYTQNYLPLRSHPYSNSSQMYYRRNRRHNPFRR